MVTLSNQTIPHSNLQSHHNTHHHSTVGNPGEALTWKTSFHTLQRGAHILLKKYPIQNYCIPSLLSP
ncbi:MAG: hypothetical protein V1726_06960 [Methanobacteriota archaeon]